MKFLITESKFDNIVFKYLDNQNFIQIERSNNIYFVNSEGDKYGQIRYDKNDGWCYIRYNLIEEISSFFSIKESDSQEVIGGWVENALKMRVTTTLQPHHEYRLRVENALKMRVTTTGQRRYRPHHLVENALKMRVTTTVIIGCATLVELRIPN